MFRGGGEGPAQIFGTFPECFQKTFWIWSPPQQILWRLSKNYNMDVIYSAISRGHDNIKENSAHIFRYLQFVNRSGTQPMKMLAELNNVVGQRHQLPLVGRGQGSLLLPWEGEQVAVVEPKPQKVVLIRCEVVVFQEVEITPVGDGPGWEHHDDWEHNRSRQWQKLNWCWLMLMLMLYRPHYQRICFFAFLYFWNSLFAFLERLPTKGSNWTPLIQKTWNYHGNQTKTMKTMILPFKKHGN